MAVRLDDRPANAASDEPRPRPILHGLPSTRVMRCWQSPVDRSRRYAVGGERFYKMVRRDAAAGGPARRQDLAGECALLRHAEGTAGVPRVLDLLDDGPMQVLIMERLDGEPLSRVDAPWPRLLVVLWRVGGIVWRLARRGISHDDLRPENIVVAPDGRVHLIDFDQALRAGRLACLARSFLGITTGRTAVVNAITAPLRERLQTSLPPSLLRALKGMRNRRVKRIDAALPELPDDAGAALRALGAAWRIAAAANASSPGRSIAYYRLEREGVVFPGERSWAERWAALGHITPYAGKRVLELGCNMGLLSTFLLKEGGASAALGVDCDERVLAAAAKVAKAFDVEPELRRVDLDAADDWEGRLAAFRPDVVFALSVLNWVRDRARLLAFLGRFDEVIFEGHDSTRIERRRLHDAGFATVDLVATSERGRPVLHCRR